MGLSDVLIDEPSEFCDTLLFERHPDLQRAKPAAGLQTVFIEPVSGREAAWCLFQIFLCHREARPMSGGIANQNAADFEGRMQPFVRVKCNEIARSKPCTR